MNITPTHPAATDRDGSLLQAINKALTDRTSIPAEPDSFSALLEQYAGPFKRGERDCRMLTGAVVQAFTGLLPPYSPALDFPEPFVISWAHRLFGSLEECHHVMLSSAGMEIVTGKYQPGDVLFLRGKIEFPFSVYDAKPDLRGFLAIVDPAYRVLGYDEYGLQSMGLRKAQITRHWRAA